MNSSTRLYERLGQIPQDPDDPQSLDELTVCAFGAFERYYVCWKEKSGNYKQDGYDLPKALQEWLFPTDGTTRDLPSLQVVFGRGDEYFASDKDGKMEFKEPEIEKPLQRTDSQEKLDRPTMRRSRTMSLVRPISDPVPPSSEAQERGSPSRPSSFPERSQSQPRRQLSFKRPSSDSNVPLSPSAQQAPKPGITRSSTAKAMRRPLSISFPGIFTKIAEEKTPEVPPLPDVEKINEKTRQDQIVSNIALPGSAPTPPPLAKDPVVEPNQIKEKADSVMLSMEKEASTEQSGLEPAGIEQRDQERLAQGESRYPSSGKLEHSAAIEAEPQSTERQQPGEDSPAPEPYDRDQTTESSSIDRQPIPSAKSRIAMFERAQVDEKVPSEQPSPRKPQSQELEKQTLSLSERTTIIPFPTEMVSPALQTAMPVPTAKPSKPPQPSAERSTPAPEPPTQILSTQCTCSCPVHGHHNSSIPKYTYASTSTQTDLPSPPPLRINTTSHTASSSVSSYTRRDSEYSTPATEASSVTSSHPLPMVGMLNYFNNPDYQLGDGLRSMYYFQYQPVHEEMGETEDNGIWESQGWKQAV